MQHNVNETILYSHMSDVSLPSRKNTAKIILTVQPSSATAERVLPLLQATTSGQQLQLLEDSLQLAIMLSQVYAIMFPCSLHWNFFSFLSTALTPNMILLVFSSTVSCQYSRSNACAVSQKYVYTYDYMCENV